MKLQRVAGSAALTGVALVTIATLTLRSAPAQVLDAQRTPLTCLVCGDVGGADLLLNIALFMPLVALPETPRRSPKRGMAQASRLGWTPSHPALA